MNEDDRHEHVRGRAIEGHTHSSAVDSVRAIAMRSKLIEKLVGTHARHALELCRVHLGQDNRAILFEEPRRATDDERLGAFHVHLDQSHRPSEREIVKGHERHVRLQVPDKRRGPLA
jgi:hypothetical protein